MNPSLNLFIVGPTGAGKTSIGRRLAAHYGLPFVDIDHEIEQQTGAPISTIFELEGEPGFRLRETMLIDGHSLQHGVVMATGAGAVLEPLNRQRLMERGYVVWLEAHVEHQLARLERDHRRPLLAGTDRHSKLLAMATARGPLYREIADLAIPGEHEGVVHATERCIALIDPQWKRQHAA
jgi:shikimate kinase